MLSDVSFQQFVIFATIDNTHCVQVLLSTPVDNMLFYDIKYALF